MKNFDVAPSNGLIKDLNELKPGDPVFAFAQGAPHYCFVYEEFKDGVLKIELVNGNIIDAHEGSVFAILIDSRHLRFMGMPIVCNTKNCWHEFNGKKIIPCNKIDSYGQFGGLICIDSVEGWEEDIATLGTAELIVKYDNVNALHLLMREFTPEESAHLNLIGLIRRMEE